MSVFYEVTETPVNLRFFVSVDGQWVEVKECVKKGPRLLQV